ncbi:MAG: hypothetical protein N2F24_03155 [Deltaproteobacteria bacterium]
MKKPEVPGSQGLEYSVEGSEVFADNGDVISLFSRQRGLLAA